MTIVVSRITQGRYWARCLGCGWNGSPRETSGEATADAHWHDVGHSQENS
jgi:hypothetical protein